MLADVRRLSALMQIAAPHQAEGDVSRLQRRTLGGEWAARYRGTAMRMCRPSSVFSQMANCRTPASSIW